jgi:hypothetical protein
MIANVSKAAWLKRLLASNPRKFSTSPAASGAVVNWYRP